MYEEIVFEKIDALDLDSLRQIFRNPNSCDSSHYIITIAPLPTNRMRFGKEIASRRIFELLWEKYVQHRIDIMAEFYELFLASSVTASTVGWIFERRMHQFLAEKRTIRLFPIQGRPADAKFVYNCYAASAARSGGENFSLTRSEEYELVEGGELKKGRYYRPKPINFPAIDSLRLTHTRSESPILLMFQITRNQKELDVSLGGLRRIDELHLPPNTRKYYVVVTPEAMQPNITIPRVYIEKGGMPREKGKQKAKQADESPGPEEAFPVFHYPVRSKDLFAD